MTASRPSPILVQESPGSRSRGRLIENIGSDGEIEVTYPVVSQSRQTLSPPGSPPDSPPITPRTQIPNPIGRFSPPSSVMSFSGDQPYPESGMRSGATSLTGSIADLSRMPSFYGARPPSSRQREAFASPPSRPLTIHSAPSAVKGRRERPKSTMLTSDGPALHKPWIEKRDPYTRIAYFITYAVAFLGIAGSAVKCYFDYQNLPFITENLCPVLDENFDSPDGVFGDNGKFFREVDMSGFG